MEKVFQPCGLVLSKGNTRYFMTKPAKIMIASSVDLVQCMHGATNVEVLVWTVYTKLDEL